MSICTGRRFAVLLLFATLFSTLSTSVRADRGLISSSQAYLNESGQVAIITWNGREEVLILSTNVEVSTQSPVMQILPLPSNPSKVVEGSLQSFDRIIELIDQKAKAANSYFQLARQSGTTYGLEVTFQETIGNHDLTVVKIIDQDYFTQWVSEYSTSRGLQFDVTEEFRETVSEYLSREIRYFVFDFIEVDGDTKTVEPLVYRFQTDFLYYPLEITAASNLGHEASTVNLFLIAKGRPAGTTFVDMGFTLRSGFDRFLEVTGKELLEVSPELADLFEGDPLVMNVHYHGLLESLRGDIIIGDGSLHSPTVFERFYQGVFETITSSYFQWSMNRLQWSPLSEKAAVIILLSSMVAGIPTAIIIMSRLLLRATRSHGFRGRRMLSYCAGIIVVFLPLFSNVEGIVISSLGALIFIGFAGTVSLILRLVKNSRVGRMKVRRTRNEMSRTTRL